MARNEEGGFDFVLGHTQLMGLFFVIVILLAVSFSGGYIIGRASAPAASSEASRTGGSKDTVVEHAAAASQPSSAPANPAPDTSASRDIKTADTKSAASTHPEKPAPAPVKETKPSAIAPLAAPPKPVPVASADPAPGDYWQVVATSRPDADIITQALTKKGFHAVIAPVPNDTRVRVLVGPVANAAAQAQTRADLEASGFKNPIMRKY